jgi:hypothetical protein
VLASGDLVMQSVVVSRSSSCININNCYNRIYSVWWVFSLFLDFLPFYEVILENNFVLPHDDAFWINIWIIFRLNIWVIIQSDSDFCLFVTVGKFGFKSFILLICYCTVNLLYFILKLFLLISLLLCYIIIIEFIFLVLWYILCELFLLFQTNANLIFFC